MSYGTTIRILSANNHAGQFISRKHCALTFYPNISRTHPRVRLQ